jgi:4-hydroxy-tetrahydrodipicolinate reductase
VVVDFTNPAGAAHHIGVCAQHGVPAVIGVTALHQDQMETIRKAAGRIAVVYAPNMSVGVNLLFRLVAETAGILDEGYDVEIVEMHHRMKKDAPSGTASKIAEIVRNVRHAGREVHGRQGLVGERNPQEIGLHALRGGDVVGEHTVIFAANGERLELTHKASSRRTFAAGVIRAIRFVTGQKPGLYDMKDVLGISGRNGLS